MYIDQKRILDETDGGLKIILSYFPQAAHSVGNFRRKFKLRGTEKTASATLKLLQDGTYVVTDFGGDQKPKNAILIAMEEEGCDFKTALNIIAERFGILPEGQQSEMFKPEITTREAKAEENEGEWYFEVREKFTDLDIKTVLADKAIPYKKNDDGSKSFDYEKIEKIFKKYHFFSLSSYSIVKNRKVITIAATDQYPIMMWDEGNFKKIYQPLSPDKSRRFMYYGKRDKDFLHGLSVCNMAYDDLQEDDDYSEEEDDKKKKEKKLEEILYCSGGSDGMNLAMIGYQVVWGNSETAKLSTAQFKKLSKISERVMNMPDIDTTGKREAHRLALEHLELYTIVLPEELKSKPDKRGNPSKDVRDYLKHYNAYDFKNLVKTALPYQFYDVQYVPNKTGGGYKKNYVVKNTRMYNFLAQNGFFRIESENDKSGWIYIKITDNVVEEINVNEVKNFINTFFKDRYMEEDLRDTFYRSNQVNDSSMSNLPLIEIDFTDYDKHTQYFFFQNKTVEVKANQIKDYKLGEINRYVWEEEVIKHQFKLEDPHFIISKRTDGSLDIEIKKHDNIFLNFLINTSRVHWRKELEDSFEGKPESERLQYFKEHQFDIAGPNLNEEEQMEQKWHLINKIYTMGYVLHRHKDPSRPWAVFGMDDRIGGDGESHGGSGKSLAYKATRLFMKTVTLDGKNPKITEDQFIYSGVNRHTDLIMIDDCHQYLNFQFFFAPLTGELTVNPKQAARFEIPYKDVPKFILTSNFTIRNLDSSTERRLIYSVFSDYYHENSNNFYKQVRQPKDDFGKNILGADFTDADWNAFYNFMIQCCQMYMNHDKINPPMNNVFQRNMISEMGHQFLEWADVYFSKENYSLNEFIVKQDAFEDFKKFSKVNWQMQKFTKSLKAYCKLRGYELDPEEHKNGQGRIIRTQQRPEGSKAMEMIFIKVDPDKLDELDGKEEMESTVSDMLREIDDKDIEDKF